MTDLFNTGSGNYDANNWVQGGPGYEEYYINRDAMESIGNLLQAIFNGSASLPYGGDNYYSSEWSAAIVEDIYGPDPIDCDLDPGTGIQGFENRLQNVATSLSNRLAFAQVSDPCYN
jgi:hypothetical protein